MWKDTARKKVLLPLRRRSGLLWWALAVMAALACMATALAFVILRRPTS